MVASVTSNGFQPQVPASNIFQPGGTEDQKRNENSQRSASPFDRDSVNAPSSTSRPNPSIATERAASAQVQAASAGRSEDNGASSTRANRGTNLDVTV